MSSLAMADFSGAAPSHLGAVFFERVEQLGERPFVKLQRAGRFEELSWREFGAKVAQAMLGLSSLGLQRGERVGILAENRMEWLCADMASLASGLPNVVVSPRLSESTILKILSHSGARAAFVENEAGVGRLLNLKGQLPSLSHIIVMDGTGFSFPNTLSFDELLLRGRESGPGRIRAILESVHPDDLATIMYTSGSTGEPKGVMRTQRNIIANIDSGHGIALSKPEELAAVVLTLNHLLGRFTFHKGAATGRTTALLEATELEVNLQMIEALSPTSMTLVPRVMQKIWAALLAEGENGKVWEGVEGLDQLRAEKGSLDRDQLRAHESLKAALREAVRRSLGGRIKYITYSGAPMSPRIIRFFEVAGIPLLGSYGSTECGGVTLSGIGENRPGSAGRPFSNVEVRIADDGEILVRGPAVTPGYFHNPQATAEVLDPDGWFHSGDLGSLDSDGFLRIVGRKKDVFYCADGSNIYPGRIELLLENDLYIRQAVLLGDHLPFMSALLVPEWARIAAERKKPESSLAPAEVEELLWPRVEKINARLEDPEKIRKIVVLKKEFPEEVRGVTTFQKIKVDRKAVAELYRREIEGVYR